MTPSASGMALSKEPVQQTATETLSSTRQNYTEHGHSRPHQQWYTPSGDSGLACLAPIMQYGQYRRCRKCYKCISAKRWSWVYRMIEESEKWPRLWMITLTYSGKIEPQYSDIQKWIRSVRKTSHEKFSYVVTEEHGAINRRFHYHLIVYCNATLKQRHLRSRYKNGISEAKLVPKEHTNRAIKYVAQYLLKQNRRVRASNNIGGLPAAEQQNTIKS